MNDNQMSLIPVGLEKTGDRKLLIRWQDGTQQTVTFRELRQGCRCAHCLEREREGESTTGGGQAKLSNQLPVLSAAEARPLDIVKMEPAGNYGYKIRFSDGHSSGIYSFELLRALGTAD
jgi:DUF971 family protein